jgi:predicted nucleotidyltransferase
MPIVSEQALDAYYNTQQPPTLEALRHKRNEIMTLATRYGAFNIRVFGSVARGDATIASDIDLLVSFRRGVSLFEVSAFWQDMQGLLGYPLNIISEGGLTERFWQRIADDVVSL